MNSWDEVQSFLQGQKQKEIQSTHEENIETPHNRRKH
jgi:hypothetical protein